MLAWVHQAIAAEREFFEALFSLKEDGRMVGSVRTWDGREEDDRIADLMDGAVGGFCGPLKVVSFFFFVFFDCIDLGLFISCRLGFSRLSGPRRAASFCTRLQIYFNSTVSLCGGH
jgi:hypothetical protein